MLDKGGAIGQIRQGIMMSHVLDAGLRLLTFGNIFREAKEGSAGCARFSSEIERFLVVRMRVAVVWGVQTVVLGDGLQGPV